jgi:hypothetical protein
MSEAVAGGASTRLAGWRGRLVTLGERPPFGRHTLLILFAFANLVLCVDPLVPQLFGHGKGKDYPLWYAVGHIVLTGGDLYPKVGSHPFAFLYPPFAAVTLAPFSLFGRTVSIVCIDIVNVVSWWAAAALSLRLSPVALPRPWWVAALPSALALPFIWDMYDLGQPNLMLLAMVLGGFWLSSRGREWPAGALFAAAAALKAFPAAILPYLIWRRRWRAAGSMVLFIGVFLLLFPAPFRGFQRNLAEVRTWGSGMVFSAGEKGFGQRPEQNWGWKNNSLIAVTHRYLRPINAEAENPKAKPLYVNFLDLSFAQANLALAVIALGVGLGFVAILPTRRERTPGSDAAEYALVVALATLASPLARAYYFIWLLFPYTVLVDAAALDPDRTAQRRSAIVLAAAVAVFTVGVSIDAPHIPQALGNMFWATAIVIGALAWLMRRRAGSGPGPEQFDQVA